MSFFTWNSPVGTACKSNMKFFLCLLCLLLSGCGYHVGQGGIEERYSSITIPYAGGDEDGRLTASLIRELSESSTLEYSPSHGQLILSLKILKIRNKNIGYRYDRSRKTDKLLDTIIPTETRRTVFTEVSVIEGCSGTILVGPAQISAYVDFDHDFYSSRDGINVFSLGQLGDIDAAYDAALTPLYNRLAEKIVNFIIHS